MTILPSISIPAPNLINFIPDTSWLLNQRSILGELGDSFTGASARSTPVFTEVPNPNYGFLSSWFGEDRKATQPYVVPHTWVLLEEVLEEVAILHANNSEKRESTGHAKLLLRDIMERTCFERVRGVELEAVPLLEGTIGLDSTPDHLLLNVAIQRSQTWKYGMSFILTADTGLMLEASSQNRENGHRVFTKIDFAKLPKVVASFLFEGHPEEVPEKLYPTKYCSWDCKMAKSDFKEGPDAAKRQPRTPQTR